MVVKGDEPRCRRMRGLQVGIALVLGVAAPVIIQRVDLRADVVAQVGERLAVHLPQARLAFAFVDVITIVEDEIERFLGNAPPRGVVAFFVVLATGHCKAHAIHRGRGCGQRTGATNRTGVATDTEAVPVRPSGRQPVQLHVHGVAEFGMRHRRPLAYHPAHAFVCGQLPLDQHRPGRHAAAEHQRFGRQARPQHHAIGRGITRGHAQGEGCAGKARLGQQVARVQRGGIALRGQRVCRAHPGTGSGQAGQGQESPAIDRLHGCALSCR